MLQDALWAKARQDTFLIVGFSDRSGLAAARLFERHGVRYKISDMAPRSALSSRLVGLRISPSDVYAGCQEPSQVEGITKIVVSPGVPRTIPLLTEAVRRAIPVWSDIDFIYEFIAHKKIVAITGTDGKTTTTTLVGELLGRLGPVVVAGNIGIPVLDRYDQILQCEWLVLELSSFMLEELSRFRATISVILNVAQDHIDRYACLHDYAQVKFNMVRHGRPQDLLIRNVDDPLLRDLCPSNVRIRSVSTSDANAEGFLQDGLLRVGDLTIPREACGLKGVQNVINLLSAVSVAQEAGVVVGDTLDVLKTFRGVPHRMQFVGRFQGVDVYDDSKASNVHAVDAALQNFPRGVVLILGGRDKGLNFSVLRQHASRLRCLVCYGEDGESIRDSIGFAGALYRYRFEDCVRLAASQCKPGDALVLSPGCTSWDQFPNYEVRGDVFQALVPQCFA